jgi:hypothetical protein
MRRSIIVLAMFVMTAALNAATPAGDLSRTEERESMESLYSVLSTMPMADRKVVFHGLAAKSKAALWGIHLERFTKDHALSADQKALVGQAILLLTPEFYTMDQRNPRWESQVRIPLREFDEKARALFPRDLAIEAFAQLGPSDIDAIIVASAPVGISQSRQAEGINRRLIPVPLLPSECSCSVESDWCWGFSTCGIGGVTCYYSPDGCGTGWSHACDSKCSYGR